MKTKLLSLLILFGTSIVSAQWVVQQSNMPAAVDGNQISAVNQNVAWASGTVGMFYAPCNSFTRTVDGGENWIAGTIPIPADFFITCLSAVNADTAWVAVGNWTKSPQAGIYKTKDGGITWTHQTTGFPDSCAVPGFVFFFDTLNGLTIFDPIDSCHEIYTTSDGGTNWNRVPNSSSIVALPGEYTSVQMFSVADSVFYFGCAYGSSGRIFKSSDKGKSWTHYNTGYKTPSNIHVWPAFKDSLHGLVVASANTTHIGISRTSDGGKTWERVPSPQISAISCAYIPGTDSGYMISSIGYGKYPGSAFTLDNGATWTIIDKNARGIPVFVSRDIGWAGGGSNTIYKWTISSVKNITAFPKAISFTFGSTSTKYYDTVYVTNYSIDTLTISNVTEPGENFELTYPSSLPVKLATLNTLTLNLHFTSPVPGIFHDTVFVVSDASNTPNLAIPLSSEQLVQLCKASASSFYSSGVKTDYAIDGNMNTRWGSSWANNQWLKVKLDTIHSVDKVVIYWEAAYANKYKILTSLDDVTWDTVYSKDAGDGNKDTILFNPVEAGYIKLLCIQRATQYGFSIYEFEVYSADDYNAICKPTALNNIKYPANIFIYPNPAENQVNIEFNQYITNNTTIKLIDISGKVVYLEKLKTGAKSTHTIDLSSFEAGIYLLKISNAEYNFVEKVIIIK